MSTSKTLDARISTILVMSTLQEALVIIVLDRSFEQETLVRELFLSFLVLKDLGE